MCCWLLICWRCCGCGCEGDAANDLPESAALPTEALAEAGVAAWAAANEEPAADPVSPPWSEPPEAADEAELRPRRSSLWGLAAASLLVLLVLR